MGNSNLTFYVTDALKVELKTFCETQGIKLGDLVRETVREKINQNKIKPFFEQQASPDLGKKKRLYVRLTPSEEKALKQQVEIENCSTQQWIINAIRASLTHEPQFTKDAITALRESSLNVQKAGDMLVGIANDLKEDKGVVIPEGAIQDLANFIQNHTKKVSSLLSASLYRWGIKCPE